jgi:hypothetical protein
VDDILDPGCHSCEVHHDDQSFLIIINKVGLPLALSTLLNFSHSHPFQDGRPKMIWDSKSSHMEKPNVVEREWVMGFHINAIIVPNLSKGAHRWILG